MQTFTITNNAPPTWYDASGKTIPVTVSVSVNTTLPFSMVSATGNSFTLGGGQSKQVTIRFNPTTSGNFTSSVGLSANLGAIASNSVQILVTGAAHQLISNPTQVFFIALVGEILQKNLLLTNQGTTTMSLSANASGPFSIVSSPGSFTLAPNQTQQITVQFNSTAAGTFSGALHLTTGLADIDVPISGWSATSQEILNAHYQTLAASQQVIQQVNPAGPLYMGSNSSLLLYGLLNQTSDQLDLLDKLWRAIRDGDPSVTVLGPDVPPLPYSVDDINNALLILKDHVQDQNFTQWVQQMQQQYPGFNAYVQLLEDHNKMPRELVQSSGIYYCAV